MTTPCAAGHYCSSGTISSTQTACPAGTYSDAIDLTTQLSCTECPAGHRCGSGSTSLDIENCRSGIFCMTFMNCSSSRINILREILSCRYTDWW